MSAYVIADIEVTDPEAYKEYIQGASAAVAAYGGKYLVRGGNVEILEGEWQPQRFAVLEFPTLEQAKRWYDSQEYSAAKAIRHKAANSRLFLVQGA